jgi:hypothetical protein
MHVLAFILAAAMATAMPHHSTMQSRSMMSGDHAIKSTGMTHGHATRSGSMHNGAMHSNAMKGHTPKPASTPH